MDMGHSVFTLGCFPAKTSLQRNQALEPVVRIEKRPVV
jgi:hypothetical protein